MMRTNEEKIKLFDLWVDFGERQKKRADDLEKENAKLTLQLSKLTEKLHMWESQFQEFQIEECVKRRNLEQQLLDIQRKSTEERMNFETERNQFVIKIQKLKQDLQNCVEEKVTTSSDSQKVQKCKFAKGKEIKVVPVTVLAGESSNNHMHPNSKCSKDHYSKFQIIHKSVHKQGQASEKALEWKQR